jgi:hypothetical protein
METKKKKVVSYSQYSKWFNCPHSWFLDYVKGLRKYEHNLTLSYGNAIHETLQKYVETLYTKGMLKATTFDVKDFFIDKLIEDLTKENVKYEEPELVEFIEDGMALLDEFMTAAVRLQHFPPDKYELLGIEKELSIPLINNVDYSGFIDLVLKEKATGRIKIFDFKTSRLGWNMYQKEDLSKTSQLILYKALYSKKYNVSVTQIDVEFFILRRKLYENARFKQSRIQIFSPDASQKEVKRVVDHFNEFITECFHHDGTYKTDAFYPKIPGKNKSNCKWCCHRGVNCNAIADKLE